MKSSKKVLEELVGLRDRGLIFGGRGYVKPEAQQLFNELKRRFGCYLNLEGALAAKAGWLGRETFLDRHISQMQSFLQSYGEPS